MIKNRIISSLRAIITTMLFVLANIAAIYLVDYISADFSVGPPLVQCHNYCNSCGYRKFTALAHFQTISDEDYHIYLWNRIAFYKLNYFLHCFLFH